MRIRALAFCLISLLLLGGTACGGDDPGPGKSATSKGNEKGEPDLEPEPRGPMKVPRAPFLSLPDSTAETVAKPVLEASKNERKLAFSPQRGPFGPAESVTLVYTEVIDEVLGLGGHVVLPGGKDGMALPLPVANDSRLIKASEIVWVSSERGWIGIILMRREIDEVDTQDNQAFFWSGTAFERALEQEKRIRTMSSAIAIRRLFH